MNTAAKPAVTSSEAGTRASSSRFRALICGPRSFLELAALEAADEVGGVVVGAQVVVEQLLAPCRGNVGDAHPRRVVGRVEVDARRQVVGQAAVERDEPVRARADV